MYSVANPQRMAAAFLAAAPTYDRASWLDAYAMTLGQRFPDRQPSECAAAAQLAHEAIGFCKPTLAAVLDAQLRPAV